ncbi:FAD-dependent oxidoreductase [Desulfitobacterium hafniense]|uniref:Fumarate reductase n=4 Tax=Desulfitobacterium hafniense TaxID=49338 RepID=A0A0W1JMI4_DESHA|nr:FAD-binding protein [Desulfitobacterium hafniense]ACL18529.1 fumarate reductase/succinate dehydrogenase flavoprotein domain protein [Desulfitobacterium hafniense DCB-2]KTE92937.1 fumarate reductase [Desulfitobacterium hafniense]BAE82300.1 putative fumarate reductase flavoprotein subunit [Desulfitobacterium hafniense Y51]
MQKESSNNKEEELTMNRRDFLKKASLGAAVVAGSGFLVGCNTTDATAPASAPEKWDMETDVAIVGSGNGGLSAGCAVVEEGKKAVICEIAGFIGGGSIYSGGGIHCWGVNTWEEYRKHFEDLHDPVLGKTYVETFRQTYIPWLQKNGFPITPAGGTRGYTKDWTMGSGEPGYLKQKSYFDALHKFFESKGGQVLLSTRVMRLVIDEAGEVCGVHALKNDGTQLFIKAGAVILAAGGFQANKGLTARYMGPYGDSIRTMGVPYNTGSGMLMAQGVGALTGGSFSTFSGTLIGISPNPQTEENPEAWEKARGSDPQSLPGIGDGRPPAIGWVSFLFPEDTTGLLVNLEGKRFIDESSPIDAKYPRVPQSIIKQKRGMALMIGDQAIYDANKSSEAIMKMNEAQGCLTVKGDTLEELAVKLQETYGFYKGAFLKTISEYNKAIDNGTADQLDVPRVAGHHKIAQGPFYAFPTGTCAYHTFGGLVINEKAQVLDVQRQPIKNLYAAPPTAAMFKEPYGGGVAAAGTFGYIAAKVITKGSV